MEAEYKALVHCAVDVWWIRNMIRDLHVYLPSAPVLHCDNISALAVSTNPVFHSRIKHLDTDFHFIREKVQKGDLLVHYVSTIDQVANILTKGLHSPVFVRHCVNLNLGIPVDFFCFFRDLVYGFTLKNTTPVSYAKVHVSRKDEASYMKGITMEEGDRPKIYTEEHEKL
ncbi:hypothetical protein FF1_003218 [Malus domestica]